VAPEQLRTSQWYFHATMCFLEELIDKGIFVWIERQQHAFETMKAIIVKDCLVQYPEHNLSFNIYTDASNYQLGAVIMQQNIPLAYYSRKLNNTQKNYTTLEK
jgi:hypothetical protein